MLLIAISNQAPIYHFQFMENTMKSLAKLGTIILPLAMLTACANTAEMDALKASVEAAKSTADSALVAAQRAQSTADSAARAAADAETTALEARSAAQAAQSSVDECCAKIDRMFEKAMSK
jgi:multidrug efflux pump subunit AcrA (membrane-fusion protein)